MKIKHIVESTTSGSIASVAAPMGKTQKRAGSLFKGKKTSKPFYEEENKPAQKPKKDFGKMFQKKVDQSNKAKKDTEEKVKAHTVKEDEILEQDLILVPDQIIKKDRSFVPHEADRRDHEVEMARSELYAAAKNAMRIYKLLANRSEDEGLMGWQQSYITLAADYLNSVADSVEYNAQMDEMTGGVLAGGMSNFEEGVAEEQAPMFTPEEEQLDEKKDACYSKVKSRYKVWPSAYASGALSKCRKVGAANWGNKSKK